MAGEQTHDKEEIALLNLLEMDGCTCEQALFLTYSLSAKTQLLALMKLFGIKEDSAQRAKKESGTRLMKQRLIKLLQYPDAQNPKEHINMLRKRAAFVCSNGCAIGRDSLIGVYTSAVTYYYKTENSFHPKLYIIKFKNQEDGKFIYRIIVGSMNFTNSSALEMLAHFDLEVCEEGEAGLNIINELLDIKEDGTGADHIIGNDRKVLLELINELGLHKALFKQEELSKLRFITFPLRKGMDIHKEPIDLSTHIFSPFLTKDFLERNTDAKVYTMEEELIKLGYQEITEDVATEDVKEFFVFQVDDKKVFNHIKLYETKEQVYIGSLNYTASAWTRNKEIVIGLDKKVEMSEFVKRMKENYQPKRYKLAKKAEERNPEVISERFKKCMRGVIAREEIVIELENIPGGIRITLTMNEKAKEQLKPFADLGYEIRVSDLYKKTNYALLEDNAKVWDIKKHILYSEDFQFELRKNACTEAVCCMGVCVKNRKGTGKSGKDKTNDRYEVAVNLLENLAYKNSTAPAAWTDSIGNMSDIVLSPVLAMGKMPTLEDVMIRQATSEKIEYETLRTEFCKRVETLKYMEKLSQGWAEGVNRIDTTLLEKFFKQAKEM